MIPQLPRHGNRLRGLFSRPPLDEGLGRVRSRLHLALYLVGVVGVAGYCMAIAGCH